MEDTAVLETLPAAVMEALHSATPTATDILGHHLDHDAQKRIAVQNLNKISFLVAPDGNSAVSTKELNSPEHGRIIEASLKTLLGERIDNAPYLAQKEGMFGLASGGNFVEIAAPAHIKMLAKAGVKDFADALGISHSTHAARVR